MEWLGEVPVCLRQDVLGRSYGLLFSTIGRVTEMCSSTVPIMLASVMEAVYSPALASVDIWTDFHWHQEARLKVRALNVINRFLSLKITVQILRNFANFVDVPSVLQVLHLLHSQEAAVRSLNFACYKTPIFQFQALSFSERFLLMNVLNKFPQVGAGLWLVEAGHVTSVLTSDWSSCGS